jgi:Membrane protein involved in the export of O-antigen and teichoic acid
MNSTVKSLSIQSVSVVITGILEVIMFAVFSRLLTKEQFGLFAIIQGVRGIGLIFSELSIGAAIIQRNTKNNLYINTAFSVTLFLGLLIGGSIFYFSEEIALLYNRSSELDKMLEFVSMTFVFYSLGSVARSILTRDHKFKELAFSNIFSQAISFMLIGIILAFLNYGVWALIIATLIDSILKVLFYSFYSRYIPKITFSLEVIKDILSFGGGLTLSRIFLAIYQHGDKLILAKILNLTSLGGIARIMELLSQATIRVGNIFDSVLFPTISKISDDTSKVRTHYIISFYSLLNIFTPFYILLMVNSNFVIELMFGKQWAQLNTLFVILIWSSYIRLFIRLNDCYLRSVSAVNYIIGTQVFAAIVFSLSLIAGAQFSLTSITISVVIADTSIFIIKTIYLKRSVKFKFGDMIKPNIVVLITNLGLLLAFIIVKQSLVNIGSVYVLLINVLILLSTVIFFPKGLGAPFTMLKEKYL